MPDGDLIVKDIWPLADRAFALAESQSFGIKVLEWNSADSTWRYIDDNSQNEALADNPTKIWSPNADEVYYAVGDGVIHHGTRPVPPATAWSWSREGLANNLPAFQPPRNLALGVWGTGDDVYAWYSNTIYRRRREGGDGPAWVSEYVANDADFSTEYLVITGAAGTRTDDVWFIGARVGTGLCSIAIRKTTEGYRRIADAVLPVPGASEQCTARAGLPLIPGANTFAVQLQSPDGHRFYALQRPNQILRIAPEGAGYSMGIANVPPSAIPNAVWTSLWSESEDRLWLGGGSNWGIVVRGSQVWTGGTYEYSSTALNGAPLTQMPLQIRGTSSANLWAVGKGYALHKTTP